MTTNPAVSSNITSVRGTELLPDDSREVYRQKIARITLDSMVQFVGLLDAEGTVLEINQVALDAVGVSLSDVEGCPFWTTFWWQVTPEINAELRDMIRRAAAGEFVRWDAEIYGRSGGEETIIIDASLMPVRDDNGNVVFIAAEGRDITEKKAYEQEIARQREELAQLDELKTQFFANISHEFRTPLTLMMGPLEDVLSAPEKLPPEVELNVQTAHRNSLRLQRLVNALLDFSRIQSGRIEASYERVDLGAFTGEIASMFRAAIERAGLRFVVDAPSSTEETYVDRDMWEKIVLNLLSNALKFTFEGEVRVTLREIGSNFELSIADSGTGIPAEELPHVFERFRRVRDARSRTFEGSGIGLSFVQELARIHGGEVTVESIYGEGSTFSVRIPLGRAHLPADRIGATKLLASTAIGAAPFVEEALRWLPDAPGETVETPETNAAPESAAERPIILVADDNSDMREYVSRLLDDRWEVVTAADGIQALEAARTRDVSLVVTDVMMPGMDGFELLQALKGDPATDSIPVILLSARAGEEAKLEGLQAGADDYLIKPFSAKELVTRVATQLERRRSEATLADHLRDLQEQSSIVRTIEETAAIVAGELDLDKAVQAVTDAATRLTGAEFGAFFYNVIDASGEKYMLYTISGVDPKRFENFPMPRATAVFAPTFKGEGILRLDDVTKDERYGHSAPYHGMPQGHLPVRSYLAVPVVSRTGEVLGGLFFGHQTPGMFEARHEQIAVGLSGWAALAIENARLYSDALEAERQMAAAAVLKDQFLGLVSHELRTPISTIMGNSQLLLRRADRLSDEDKLQALTDVVGESERLQGIIENLLILTRLDAGKELTLEPVSLSQLVEDVVDSSRRRQPTRTIVSTPKTGLPPVTGERTLIKLVIENLVSNAIKYSQESDPVEVAVRSDDAGQVSVHVYDRGIGFPEDEIGDLFNPFFRSRAAAEQAPGMGLGLAVCQRVIEAQGGDIGCRPREGGGSEFYFSLSSA